MAESKHSASGNCLNEAQTLPPLIGPPGGTLAATSAGAIASSPNGSKKPAARPNRLPLNQIYALPAPIRTFPLPSFYPSNPLSLFHLAYAWLRQAWSPPPAEPSVIHAGVWSPESRSVRVVDGKSMRALWEQGFYGKGNYSRSEPNWLRKEQARLGLIETKVSEQMTVARREERRQAKWERARAELDAIRQTRLEEAQVNPTLNLVEEPLQAPALSARPVASLGPPIGPLELLALPNSLLDLHNAEMVILSSLPSTIPTPPADTNHVVSTESIRPERQLNGSVADPPHDRKLPSSGSVPVSQNGTVTMNGTALNGIIRSPPSTASSSDPGEEGQPLKRRKSVRFSPKVESTTFQLSDPPSPSRALPTGKVDDELVLSPVEDNSETSGPAQEDPADAVVEPAPPPISLEEIQNKEHLQLTAEESFFLCFGLGALRVLDPATGDALSTTELFDLFRRYSHYPPKEATELAALQPDDGFLVQYAVYHHFRSLGWVPRGGLKFGVDWMLYTRGPVFDHAEFGLIVIPSYSDPWWQASGRTIPRKSWHWLHGINRVLSHVMKSLVLVYVDVPPPPTFDDALVNGFASVFETYKIREILVKRWSSNRNRG